MKKRKSQELHFSDIDEPLKQHYIKNILVLIIAFFVSIIFSVTMKQLHFFLMAMIVIACYCCIIFFQIYQILENKVVSYTGVCQEIHLKEKKMFDMDYILIKNNADGMLLRIIPHSKKEMRFSKGDTIKVYSPIDGDKLPKINNNTYSIPSFYFMCCVETHST